MTAEDERTVLLTGATGVVGWVLATRFAGAGFGVHMLVRKASRKRLRERVSQFRMSDPAAADRMRLITGDLTDPDITDADGRARIVGDCVGVVHCANERRADKSRDQVFDVNVGGTRGLLALAGALTRGCSRFLHVSDLRVVGDHRPVFDESMLFARQGFAGEHALESRMLAERWVRRAARDLPVAVLRVAHPVGVQPDRTRVADPLPRILAGRSSLRARFGASPWVHVVTAQHLGDVALAAWSDAGCLGQTLHVADPGAPTLAELCARLGRGVPRADCSDMPGPYCAIDTSNADALLRRARLKRPTLDEVVAAMGYAVGGSAR